MPIATRVSRKLHEVFGQEAAEAMVDWMQRVDSSRSELRELNDLSFARFGSRLNERIAQTEAKIEALDAKMDANIAVAARRLQAVASPID
jgi:hypothetical protein